MRTVGESVCPKCGGVVHEYLFTASCSCGKTWEETGYACFHSKYGTEPSGCTTYSEVEFETLHEHTERMRICGMEEDTVLGRVEIEIPGTDPVREMTVRANYEGSLEDVVFGWLDAEGKVTEGESITVTKNGKYSLHIVHTENGDDYETVQEISVTNIDREGPVIQSLKPDRTGATNKPVILTVRASDPSGLAKKAYSIDGKNYQKENTFEIKENGDYRIFVRDVPGNVSTSEITVSNLDYDPPKLKLSATPKEWEEGDCEITASANDSGLGLADAPYSFDKGKNWGKKNHISLSESGSVEVWARDSAGNIAKERITVTRKEKPKEEPLKEENPKADLSKETEESKTPAKDIKSDEKTAEGVSEISEKSDIESAVDESKKKEEESAENKSGEGLSIGTVLEDGTNLVILSSNTLNTDSKAVNNAVKPEENRKKIKSEKTEEKTEEEILSKEEESDVESGEDSVGEENRDGDLQSRVQPEPDEKPDDKTNENSGDGVGDTSPDEKENPDKHFGRNTVDFFRNTMVSFWSGMHVIIYKIPKNIRIVTITGGTLSGLVCVWFGTIFLIRSAGIFWRDDTGKEHFLSRNLIHRKGEIYELRIKKESLRGSESRDLVLRMPFLFFILHKYRPICIYFGENMVSQHVEKVIRVQLPV